MQFQERALLPVILNPTKLRVGLSGRGVSWERRRQSLADAGVEPILVGAKGEDRLDGLHVLYIAGLGLEDARRLAHIARRSGVLVNVEDEPDLCDFHVPAVVRRGELLLTVSSAGRSPGLVKLLREWLAERLGKEWGSRLDDLGRRRDDWRKAGLPPSTVSERTREIASRWLV